MSTQQAVAHTNEMVFKLKEMHRKKVEEMQKMIDSLKEEIRIIQEFDNRLDEL